MAEKERILTNKYTDINCIYKNTLSWNTIEKVHLATWGLEPVSPFSVNSDVPWQNIAIYIINIYIYVYYGTVVLIT